MTLWVFGRHDNRDENVILASTRTSILGQCWSVLITIKLYWSLFCNKLVRFTLLILRAKAEACRVEHSSLFCRNGLTEKFITLTVWVYQRWYTEASVLLAQTTNMCYKAKHTSLFYQDINLTEKKFCNTVSFNFEGDEKKRDWKQNFSQFLFNFCSKGSFKKHL